MMKMICLFNNVRDTKPKYIDLVEWLQKTINPPDDLKEAVLKYRETGIKRFKQDLPAVTISASFNDHRNLENIKEYSGFICIDIDRYSKSKKKPSNPCIDLQLAKELFINHPSVFYVGKSCGGDGLYIIIKIAEGDQLKKYFEHFQKKFQHIGINIDNSCSDYTRLRLFSYDPEAFLNVNARSYKIKEEVAEKTPEVPKKTSVNNNGYLSNQQKVEQIIDLINKHKIDITSDYNDWIKIGGALASEFAESGEYYFQEISKFHPDFHAKICADQYKSCLRNMNKCNLSSLFYIASSYGIKYSF